MATTKQANCTAIVSYKVGAEDADAFLEAWHKANDHLKKQPGHVSTTLHRAVSANPSFRFVNVARWKSADAFRQATQTPDFQAASGRLEAYPIFASVYEDLPG
jgi:heme-degrading monooxygenase HmoA